MENAVAAPAAVTAPAPDVARRREGVLARIRDYLPEGRGLPLAEWQVRHRGVVVFLYAHAVGLAIFGLVQGWAPKYALGEGALIAAMATVAALPSLNRSMRAAVAALAAVTSSAVLVQFWGGVIEAHFHFFVVVALISLYQDWAPFLVAVGFVAFDHGLLGSLAPEWVYNHADAIAHPWKWAAIHAVLVLAECAALIIVWRANEQARFQTERVLRSAGEGILGVDAECRITFANPAARAMLGAGDGDVLGRPLYQCVLGADGRPLFDGPGILRNSPGTFSLEAVLKRTDGGLLPVEILCTPFEGQAHAEGAVVSVRDVSERLRAEQQRAAVVLQEQELVRLRDVNKFKTQFMNMAAHELNTPLTPIKVQLHLLKNQAANGNTSHAGPIRMLDRNFQRLSELVQELLDSTRLESNRLRLEPRSSDIASLLHDVRESFAPAAAEAGLELRLDCPSDLRATVDPLRLSQAIYNLVSNALKFTPAGGHVTIAARGTPDGIEVEVRDSGVGMTPEQMARLFQPFSQVHESQIAGHRGSGLGLYISRGIAQLHGGDLRVESQGPGTGSRFVLTLPAKAAALVAAP